MDDVKFHQEQQENGNVNLTLQHEIIHSVLRKGFKEYSLLDLEEQSREVLLEKLYDQLEEIYSQIQSYYADLEDGLVKEDKVWLSKAKSAVKGTNKSIKTIEAYLHDDPNEAYVYEFFDAAKELLDEETFNRVLEEAKYQSTVV